MFTPEVSQQSGSVYEHCKKTIDRTFFGEHGLPLMGGGDWNDGMNEVGIQGKGESVWLAWFLYTVLGDFIPLCKQEGKRPTDRNWSRNGKLCCKALKRTCLGWGMVSAGLL